MKNLVFLFTIIGTLLLGSSCKDFLDQSSKSDANLEYVFKDPATVLSLLDGAFETWRDSRIHSNGLFYELSVCSSDAERYPEKYTDQQRHIPSNFYFEGTESYPIDYAEVPWNNGYNVIAVCNRLITQIDANGLVDEQIATGTPDDLSHIYGMAVALRATIYYEFTRYFGDIPHQITSLEVDTTLTSRDYIYEYQIEQLRRVAPIMYRIGQSNLAINSNMTRTYVEGLIGRLALFAGGYATRRQDLLGTGFYQDLDGNQISFTQMGAPNQEGLYTRRTDYLKFYEIAKQYLQDLVNNPGAAVLTTTDPRATDANGRQYGNPFQYNFQQMLNLVNVPETIYEISETYGEYSERPYAFGRPSNGGGSNNYPCKSYGQSRMHATFFYGDFDPKDLRRDATVAVTASSGKGQEIMLSFVPGSKGSGGLGNNKWDENKMNPPYTASQRSSGVGNPYLRMSDVMLMLAETHAVLGDNASAKELLTQVRVRGFGGNAANADVDGFIAEQGSMLDAVLSERKLEFAGEGLRKWDLIRNGKLEEASVTLHTRLADMVNGLKTDGYYTFENGNQFSNYIWTKYVDGKTQYGYRLTSQAPSENDPVLFPGWRGQYDDYKALAEANGDGRTAIEEVETNLAIRGLFKYIDPNGSEAAALEADGYVRTRWGADIVGAKLADETEEVIDYSNEYSEYFWRGLKSGMAPIYMYPINRTSVVSSTGVSNGYGFANE